MYALRKQIVLAERDGLFRAASAATITTHFLSMMLSCFKKPTDPPGSTLFKSLPKASQVDLFLSHSWSCPSWMKLLALCHFLNLDLAIISSITASTMAVVFFVIFAGNISNVAAVVPHWSLYVCLFYWPLSIFLLTYLFGHLCRGDISFWFDRVCVDQQNLWVKVQTLQAVPAFVAQSTDLLVLWDHTLFQRLWCNYELAVHAKTSVSEKHIHFVPMWTAMWCLCWLGMYVIIGLSLYGTTVSPLYVDANSPYISMSVSLWKMYAVPLPAFFVIALPFSYFCFHKLDEHKSMLEQMAHFDVRNAKCTLETDRRVIEEQVLDLFDEALEPSLRVAFDGTDSTPSLDADEEPLLPETVDDFRHITSYPSKDEVIEQFNEYVRGPLRDNVLNSVGQESGISFKLCLVAILPLEWIGWVAILGCDGRADCQKSAACWGYGSVAHYMAGNIVVNLILLPLSMTAVPPLMLRINHLVVHFPSRRLRFLAGSCFTATVLFIWGVFLYCLVALFLLATTQFTLPAFAAFMVAFGLLIFVNCSFFI